MEIIETPLFTRLAMKFLTQEEYRQLQNVLVVNPKAGNVIPKTGGLRKVRWYSSGKGKRGGLRIIYYWFSADETLFMLSIYKKSKQEDLTSQQARFLRKLVEDYLL